MRKDGLEFIFAKTFASGPAVQHYSVFALPSIFLSKGGLRIKPRDDTSIQTRVLNTGFHGSPLH